MGRGQTDRQTHTRTCQLSDQLGPEGRVGENPGADVGLKTSFGPIMDLLANLGAGISLLVNDGAGMK